jgi:hypothetical protein
MKQQPTIDEADQHRLVARPALLQVAHGWSPEQARRDVRAAPHPRVAPPRARPKYAKRDAFAGTRRVRPIPIPRADAHADSPESAPVVPALGSTRSSHRQSASIADRPNEPTELSDSPPSPRVREQIERSACARHSSVSSRTSGLATWMKVGSLQIHNLESPDVVEARRGGAWFAVSNAGCRTVATGSAEKEGHGRARTARAWSPLVEELIDDAGPRAA